jgi:homoserine dehydrogenase
VRSLDKPRDYTIEKNCKFVTDYKEILDDPTINCVVELMGGTTHAKDVVFSAIKAGKHVVTANKALIAAHMPELLDLLAANPAVSFNFEAAVCGGIPIIHTLHSDFFSDDITKVMGIMNGTTNFMLCKMEDEGSDYSAVLKEAQDLGFAEADPTADVEGHDVQAKISILTKLAFGKTVPWETVPTVGISKITAVDFEYARILKSTIKLIGTANKNADGSLAVFVSPTMVPLNHVLASAKGPGNMVVLKTENTNQSTFAGPGAGRFPTANSVMNDLIRISLGKTVAPFPLDAKVELNNDYLSTFYVRITCADALGIVRSVGEAAEASGVSINAILQNPITTRDKVDFVVTTEEVALSNVMSFVDRVSKMPFAQTRPTFMPIL